MNDAWDRELDGVAFAKLRPAWKGERARASFERKVMILEGWARDGLPEDVIMRRTRPMLREWSDPALRLWSWSDPNVDRPGKRNADLVARFIRALAVIDQAATRASKRTAMVGRTQEAYRNLLEQNAQLMDEVVRLRKRLAAVPARIPR